MANPSLQIGNSNWAIKESNLLGYSTAGTRFLPQPITMTRASAGTRVNPQGLIETVELLGSEVVTNGDLTGGSTGWTLEAGWTYGTNALDFDSITNIKGAIPTITALVVGKIYKLTFDLSNISLTSKILFSNIASNLEYVNTNSNYVNGSYEFYFNATDTDFAIYGYSVGDSFSIDNVSVKEVTRNNLARVDYDGTASSLLVEPQRTNLATYSEDFSNASWLKVNSTVTPNTSVSPSGTLSADKFIPNNTTASIFIYNQVTFSASDYTLSFFVKYNGRQYFQLLFGSNVSTDFSNFDLINHTVTSGNGNIEDYGNDWYKISLTSNVNAATSEVYLWSIDSATSSRASASTGNGTDGVHIWGGQIEQGSYPTSYIPTSGSSVTRVAESYVLPTTISLDSDFCLFWDGEVLEGDIMLYGSGNNNSWYMNYSTGSGRIILDESSGRKVQAFLGSGSPVGVKTKILIRRSSGVHSVFANGTKLTNSVSVNSTTTLSLVSMFWSFNSSFNKGLKVNQSQVFKTSLSDSEAIALTSL